MGRNGKREKQEWHLAYPKSVHHLIPVNTEFLGIFDSELTDGESPSVKTRSESNGTLLWVDLDITESLVKVGGDDDVDGLDSSGEGLVEIFLGDLELKKSTVDLVNDTDWLDTFGKSLSQDGLGLDTDTRNTVDDDKGTVSDTEGSSDFGREIDVTRRVNQVNQELVTLDLLGDILEVILINELGVKRDSSGLDGNTSVLLVLTGICETSFSRFGGRNDTSTLDQRIGKSRLSVIDCSGVGVS